MTDQPPVVVNPQAVGDPNQTPVVRLWPSERADVTDLRTLAAEAITARLTDAWPREFVGDRVWTEQVGHEAADAALSAILGELERAGSPLCDCTPDESPPVSPETGNRMDHHCDCEAVRAASTLLRANSLTRHAQECGHGCRYDEFYRPVAPTGEPDHA